MDWSDPTFDFCVAGGQRYRKVQLPDGFDPVATFFRPGGRGNVDGDGFGVGGDEDDGHNIDFAEEDDGRWRYDERDGRYVYELPVAAVYYKFLIGSGRKKLMQMQQESNSEIRIPPPPDKIDCATMGSLDTVKILAREKHQILTAKGLIEYAIELAEPKIPSTHFINIPVALLNPQIPKDFQTKFLDSKPALEFNSHYFPKPAKLHFTLIALKLHSQNQIQKVQRILQELDRDERFKKQLGLLRFEVKLKGLHYMNDDPGQVSVLHTTDPDPKVLRHVNNLAGALFELLVANDVVTRDYLQQQRLLSPTGLADVKLHCTLLNTRFYRQFLASQAGAGEHGGLEEEETKYVNARPLLAAFGGDFDFGHVEVREIHFSDMREVDRETGFYGCVEKFGLVERGVLVGTTEEEDAEIVD